MAETILNKDIAATQPDPYAKPKRDYTKERDDACIPIARKILKVLASREDLLIGSSASNATEEKALEYYADMYVKEIGPMLIEANIKVDHLKYIFTLVRQAVQFIADRTEMTIEHHFNNATAFKWGVKDTDEIDLAMIHEALTKPPASVDSVSTEEKEA
jgi:hypothetical protein